ncbi:MAG TPA: glycosyltransferase family 2 protein [Steroidobacteraceae bacterium]|nr:glycosyltransferase family 2 protein [Steroidobacteraceae bacterium]
MKALTTSLIITTYEWPAALDLTLGSAARQSVLPDEIIVADDGSGPETQRVVDAWRELIPVPLHHLWQPHEGFRLARSRNRAIARASGEYLVIVDGDMVMHRHFIADHRLAARARSFIQGVRLITGSETADQMLRCRLLDLGIFSPDVQRRRHCVRSRLLSRLLFFPRTGQRAIRGCNQAYWKHDLLAVNGFNEAMIGWGREDNEIAARLYHRGIVRRNLKFQALAIHLHHPRRAPQGFNPNDYVLNDTLERRLTWCERGLDSHLAGLKGRMFGRSAPAMRPSGLRAVERA